MEAELTFVRSAGGAAGGAAAAAAVRGGRFFEGVGSVAATAEAASMRVHHSIVELPDAGYEPRVVRSALRILRHRRSRTTRRSPASR